MKTLIMNRARDGLADAVGRVKGVCAGILPLSIPCANCDTNPINKIPEVLGSLNGLITEGGLPFKEWLIVKDDKDTIVYVPFPFDTPYRTQPCKTVQDGTDFGEGGGMIITPVPQIGLAIPPVINPPPPFNRETISVCFDWDQLDPTNGSHSIYPGFYNQNGIWQPVFGMSPWMRPKLKFPASLVDKEHYEIDQDYMGYVEFRVCPPMIIDVPTDWHPGSSGGCDDIVPGYVDASGKVITKVDTDPTECSDNKLKPMLVLAKNINTRRYIGGALEFTKDPVTNSGMVSSMLAYLNTTKNGGQAIIRFTPQPGIVLPMPMYVNKTTGLATCYAPTLTEDWKACGEDGGPVSNTSGTVKFCYGTETQPGSGVFGIMKSPLFIPAKKLPTWWYTIGDSTEVTNADAVVKLTCGVGGAYSGEYAVLRAPVDTEATIDIAKGTYTGEFVYNATIPAKSVTITGTGMVVVYHSIPKKNPITTETKYQSADKALPTPSSSTDIVPMAQVSVKDVPPAKPGDPPTGKKRVVVNQIQYGPIVRGTPGGGSGGSFPAKITGRSGATYTVDLYENGYGSAPTGTGVLLVLGLNLADTLNTGTWVIACRSAVAVTGGGST